MKLNDFIASAGIRLSVQPTDHNPHMTDFNGDHWKCRLMAGRSRMTIVFSKGFGHNGAEPTITEVLDCLASDATGYENSGGNFEDWAGEYGYDPDSRKAEKTFRQVEKDALRLHRLLGDSAYNALVWDVERE